MLTLETEMTTVQYTKFEALSSSFKINKQAYSERNRTDISHINTYYNIIKL
jgi:hypothetical protein